jgi:AbrB family looped-hinge helix DNA binding protein
MPTAKLTSRGRTTIPKPIRDRLRLRAGDRLDFVVRDDGTVLIVPVTGHLIDLRGMLPKPKRVATVAAMNRAIRARAAGRALGRR